VAVQLCPLVLQGAAAKLLLSSQSGANSCHAHSLPLPTLPFLLSSASFILFFHFPLFFSYSINPFTNTTSSTSSPIDDNPSTTTLFHTAPLCLATSLPPPNHPHVERDLPLLKQWPSPTCRICNLLLLSSLQHTCANLIYACLGRLIATEAAVEDGGDHADDAVPDASRFNNDPPPSSMDGTMTFLTVFRAYTSSNREYRF